MSTGRDHAYGRAGTSVRIRSCIIIGGAAGDHTVQGITAGDEVLSVYASVVVTGLTGAALVITNASGADLTDEFLPQATADNTINNAGGTSTADDVLTVMWRPRKAGE